MTIDPPMERRDIIAERLAQGQSVTAGSLAEEFSVSPDALRRDKLGTGAPHRVTPLDHIDSLVVEHDAATHAAFEAIARLGVDLVAGKSPDLIRASAPRHFAL
jgi:DeoR/GlpR family transcriptional regulator of sugar metabolism